MRPKCFYKINKYKIIIADYSLIKYCVIAFYTEDNGSHYFFFDQGLVGIFKFTFILYYVIYD